MTLQERLAAMSEIQKQSNATKPLWEVAEVRTLSPIEIEKIDYIEVTNTTFNEDKRYGEIHFKDGSTYQKLIQFESTSPVKLNERVPLDEIRWVHYHYTGDYNNITTDTLKFRRVVETSFEDKFNSLETLQERENKLLETQIQISLKEKGLIYTLDHLIDLHKNPNALHYLYQYMSKDQTAIYNLATYKYSIDAGLEFMYDEGFSAFMPYSYIMLNSIISRLTDGNITTWPSYEDCVKKHPDLKELIDAFHFSKHKEELMPFYKKRFEYINWYKKYSHIWKNEGLSYADFCSQYDSYPFLDVEVLSISDYIKDVSKYYKFYKMINE